MLVVTVALAGSAGTLRLTAPRRRRLMWLVHHGSFPASSPLSPVFAFSTCVPVHRVDFHGWGYQLLRIRSGRSRRTIRPNSAKNLCASPSTRGAFAT